MNTWKISKEREHFNYFFIFAFLFNTILKKKESKVTNDTQNFIYFSFKNVGRNMKISPSTFSI